MVWYVGASVNLVGSILINLGTNLMKLGHNRRAIDAKDLACKEGKVKLRAIRYYREWRLGMLLFAVGNVANFASFGFAAQSLLAGLGTIQFVSNVFFARLVLKEVVTTRVILATLCIVLGCVILVSFGNHHSAEVTVVELISYYSSTEYVIYLSTIAACVVIMYIVYRKGRRLEAKLGPRLPSFWLRVLPVSYALFCAPLGTQSVLFSKTLSALLRTTASGDVQLDSWFPWVVLPLFILSAVFWITRLNQGLCMFPSIVIVPTMQLSWTMFSIVSGGIYYREFATFSVVQAILFVLGASVIMFGVLLLTLSTKAQDYEELDEEIEAMEDAEGKQESIEMLSVKSSSSSSSSSLSPADGGNATKASDLRLPGASSSPTIMMRVPSTKGILKIRDKRLDEDQQELTNGMKNYDDEEENADSDDEHESDEEDDHYNQHHQQQQQQQQQKRDGDADVSNKVFLSPKTARLSPVAFERDPESLQWQTVADDWSLNFAEPAKQALRGSGRLIRALSGVLPPLDEAAPPMDGILEQAVSRLEVRRMRAKSDPGLPPLKLLLSPIGTYVPQAPTSVSEKSSRSRAKSMASASRQLNMCCDDSAVTSPSPSHSSSVNNVDNLVNDHQDYFATPSQGNQLEDEDRKRED